MKTLKKIFILFVLIFLYMVVLTRVYYPVTIAVKGEEIKISDIQVIPVGELIGIKLYTSGVLVVGTSEIEGIDGQKNKPYENTGIQEGDSIISVNDIIVNNTEELIDAINLYEGESVNIKYQRENEQLKTFAALGQAITDIDTGEILQTSSGEIDNVSIVSVIKGKEEEPGKIQGAINQNSVIGNIYKNTAYGVYGVIKNPDNINIDYNKKIYVAPRQEINLGDATILSNIDGKLKEYSVEIQRIYLNNNYDNKSMVIKIKDENLINKTGGIVQGMSGSPIIQNGKFIGAITHVFVKDPTLGYAVFADRMISELHT